MHKSNVIVMILPVLAATGAGVVLIAANGEQAVFRENFENAVLARKPAYTVIADTQGRLRGFHNAAIIEGRDGAYRVRGPVRRPHSTADLPADRGSGTRRSDHAR